MSAEPEDPSAPDLDGAAGAETDGEGEEARRDDGLDLARAIARATAKLSPTRKSGPKRAKRDRSGTGRVSGSHPDDRDPQLLGSTLGRLVDDHGWDLSLRVHGVMARWPELVGADIAAHTTPESFTDGKLVVRADSTAWATQLRLLAQSIVRRLNEELGPGTVTVLEVLGPHGPTWKRGPRSIRGARGPRDTYG